MSSANGQKQSFIVHVDVEFVSKSGWGQAVVKQVIKSGNRVKGVPPSVGEKVSIHPGRHVKQNDKDLKCTVIFNQDKKHGAAFKWFAVHCATKGCTKATSKRNAAYPSVASKRKTSTPSFSPWQIGEHALILNLPSTRPGSSHDGINLACRKCGTKLICCNDIYCIDKTSVWTKNLNSTSHPEIKTDQKKDWNDLKRCNVQKARCSSCDNVVGNFYESNFVDCDRPDQEFPCFNLITAWERRKWNGDAPQLATVLIGDESSTQASIDNLIVSDDWEVEKEILPGGKVDQSFYAVFEQAKLAKRVLQDAEQARKESEERAKQAELATKLAELAKKEAEMATKQAEEIALRKSIEAEKAKQEIDNLVSDVQQQEQKHQEAEKARIESEERAKQAERAIQQAQEIAARKSIEAEEARREIDDLVATVNEQEQKDQQKKIVWECNIDGTWIEYPPDFSSKIEGVYNSKLYSLFTQRIPFTRGTIKYEANISSMKQKNLQTGYCRAIRRREVVVPTHLPHSSLPKPIWECKLGKSWVQYASTISRQLEKAFESQTSHCFRIENVLYEIDMRANPLEQVNMESGNRRSVRRRKIIPGVPDTWTINPTGEKCQFVAVSRNTKEWAQIVTELLRTIPGASLHSIERVQNYALWRYFLFQQSRIGNLSRSSDPNLTMVWHGTRGTNPRTICTDQADGFMM